MIHLQVAVRALAAVIEQSAHTFSKRATRSKSSDKAYENRKTAAALRVEANELIRYSNSTEAKTGTLTPSLLGFLTAFCYGHLQVTEHIHAYLENKGHAEVASELRAIVEPFRERSLYVLTALKAHT